MSREEIDKLFQEAFMLECDGNKNGAYQVYKSTLEKVKIFKKLAPRDDHASIDSVFCLTDWYK
jgi:hypothetical protein